MSASAERISPEADSSSRPSTGLQEEFIEVDGTYIRVAIRPGKGRPLLLFNGIGANLDLVRPFAQAMEGVELIAFDMPGTGQSPALRLPHRFGGLARLTARMLDVLGYVEPVNVAGVSWGGAMAQQFAHQYPERTHRLILAATSAGMVALPARLAVLKRMTTPKRYIQPSYLATIAPELYGGLVRQKPELIGRHATLTRRPSLRGYVYQLLAGLGWTSFFWLYRLQVPTLVMGGDDDPIMPLVNTRLLQWLIPKSRMHVIKGGGHLFLVMRAHESAAVIKRFLREAHIEEESERSEAA